MRIFLFFLLLQFNMLQAVAAENIKHVTVNDYLQQAAARAKQEGRTANSLINESSPYLLQHAYNPVNWYAWGEAAFAKARKENKPVFLSIGYSTCHWCHVMAHESFENKKIAEILNKYFVAIKVDREQRPDIDAVYMSATQLINGHGGWPMSVFLDHKLRPFHAATYYPPFSTAEQKGLNEILLKIHDLWQYQPELIDQVATTVTARISSQVDAAGKDETLAADINALALRHIAQLYDEVSGGFSAAPKFPSPGIFAFLNQVLMTDKKSEDREAKKSAQKMMKTTLDAMLSGGIYDQLGGGFHRYSVDENWQVPHFEKMLYSQALMVMAYSDFYKIDPQPRYKQVVYDTLAFVSREMHSADAGFFSALDADSKRVDGKATDKQTSSEGAYYLWHETELKQFLSADEFAFIEKYFDVRENGNISSDPHNEFTRLNILYIDEDYRDKPLQQEAVLLTSAKKKLNTIRQTKPRPHLDDKIITAWNGMMLSAFARASLIFKDPALLAQAKQTANFIKLNLYNIKTGELYRQYRTNQYRTNQYRKQKHTASASTKAVLADYAWLIHGLLDIYAASNEKSWPDWALELQEKQDALFLDEKSGAYFESPGNDTSLLFRSKTIFDGALPSANAIALSNLRRLSELVSLPSKKKIFLSQADKLVNRFATVINENPSAAAMLLAVEYGQAATTQVKAKP